MTETNGKRNGSGMAGGLLLGMAIGAMTGLAIGFLYAPRSGQETREMIKTKADEAKRKAGDVVQAAKSKAQSIRSKGMETMEEIKRETE